MPQACQCLRGFWTMPLIPCFSFWSALNCSGGWTRWSLQAPSNRNILFYSIQMPFNHKTEVPGWESIGAAPWAPVTIRNPQRMGRTGRARAVLPYKAHDFCPHMTTSQPPILNLTLLTDKEFNNTLTHLIVLQERGSGPRSTHIPLQNPSALTRLNFGEQHTDVCLPDAAHVPWKLSIHLTGFIFCSCIYYPWGSGVRDTPHTHAIS